MKELICRIVGPDAQVTDAYNQIKARMTMMTAIMLGTPGDRTSYARLESVEAGTLDEMLHIDEFGIMRVGEYIAAEYPVWVQPTGAHDSYPALDLKGTVTTVQHNSIVWQNSHGNGNSWAPGVFGWVQV